MEENNQQFEQLLQAAPGGMAKIAFDDMLTVLFATDQFFILIKNMSSKPNIKLPISLLRMVYSADIIYLTQQLAAQKQRTDQMITFNFRVLMNDGSFRWVMITGARTEESYQNGTKTVPVYACVAVDATSIMLNYKKLEQTSDYQRIISELSKDIFFEYEIATDTLSFSEVFREVFGKDNIMTGFRKRLDRTKSIHPDELPAVVSIYNSMMSGRKQARFELRLVPKDGTAVWYTCYASIIFDENKNPYKVVGKLAMKSVIEKEAGPSHMEKQLDAATGVCTKSSAEQLITEASAKNGEEELSAIMVIDIRNFKNINEVRRSLNGDTIFTSVGNVLKDHARTSDIIGRLGISEFVLYIRSVPTERTVFELADHLCSRIEAVHSYEHTKNGILCSIGIALHRGAGEYQTLLANANTALVMAKKVPTSSFEIFGGVNG